MRSSAKGAYVFQYLPGLCVTAAIILFMLFHETADADGQRQRQHNQDGKAGTQQEHRVRKQMQIISVPYRKVGVCLLDMIGERSEIVTDLKNVVIRNVVCRKDDPWRE